MVECYGDEFLNAWNAVEWLSILSDHMSIAGTFRLTDLMDLPDLHWMTIKPPVGRMTVKMIAYRDGSEPGNFSNRTGS